MRIDGNNPIQPSQSDGGLAGKAKGSQAPGANPAGASEASDLILSLQPYIQKASSTGEIDEQAVAQAKALLQSGQLDTADAVVRAAEAMLKRGL